MPSGSPQAKQLCHLHIQFSLGQSCHRQKCLASLHAGSLWSCLNFCDPNVDCGLPGFSVRGFSKQEYWSVLANPGCHVLLEHYISCYPHRELPWVPGAVWSPATQAAASPPCLALTGASPSPPGQTQEWTPVDNPHAEVEIKPQLKPRGSVAKEEDPNPSHSYTSCTLNLCDQLERLFVSGIYKRTLRAPREENALVLIAVDIGGKNTQE